MIAGRVRFLCFLPCSQDASYFYTTQTEALLLQNQAFNSDQFDEPGSNDEEGEGGKGANKPSLGRVFGYTAGPAVGAYLVVVTLGLVGGVIWWKRSKKSGKSGESIPLVKQR